ncbi:MAG: bifunctional oligoribonuclease/PAP phosphatase NrnA [Chlorobi bacterium]|nr:bifunctional oligoribonuclease/PAP phosphatase NrnA [Chlorobiota bacterium]MCI0715429.1 bifunctional oligoribonuclease/PAP phosphatase NrnA [Chlorobiota bacterium]
MFKEIAELINKNQEFILTSHVNPDGDSIGSEIALYIYLKKQGKHARIINFSETPANFTFLDKDNIIEQFDETKHKDAIEKADVIFILDTNEYERVRTMAPHIKASKAKKVVIDHHLGFSDNGFDYYISDTDSPATGEIIYRFLKNSGSDAIDKDIAIALYTAIMTDTGSFRFDRTDSETHNITAELLKFGADPFEIYSEVYNKATIGRLHLLGRFLNNIQLVQGNSIVYSTVSQKDFAETQTDEYAIDGFSSHLMSLETVKLGIVITEAKRGVKISFRSKGEIYCNELAKEFGGGGHQNAAGAFVLGAKVEEISKDVIEKAKNYIK